MPTEDPIQQFHQCNIITLRSKLAIISIRQGHVRHWCHNSILKSSDDSEKTRSNDLEQAASIQAGLHETQVAAQKNKEELEKQQAALKQQQAELTEQQKKIAANKAAVAAAVARFGQLDDYYIFDETTIYFGNGQVKVEPKYVSPLLTLAEKAKTING